MAGFLWKVAIKGYQWGDDVTGPSPHTRVPGPVLLPIVWEFSTYQPLKEQSGLFRTFATTPLTMDGIRAFANKYGLLGEGGRAWGLQPSNECMFRSDKERSDYERTFERISMPQRFQDWRDAIVKMQRAVDLLDQIRANAADVNVAKSFESKVDSQLRSQRVVPRCEIDPRPPLHMVLHLVPNTLGGAMWLQLAQAAAENKDYRACRECTRYFELSPQFARANKRYCSDACRSKAYRFRKVRARRLCAAGKPLGEIADQVESDTETVRRWVK